MNRNLLAPASTFRRRPVLLSVLCLMLLPATVLSGPVESSQVAAGPPESAINPLPGLTGLEQAEPRILPVDEAFRFGFYQEGESVTVFWQVLPGYYLYRDRLRFELGGNPLEPVIQEGEIRDDEIFGLVQVLDGLIEVRLDRVNDPAEVSVYYQGCAAAGYCYPPQKKQLSSAKSGLISGNAQPILQRESPGVFGENRSF